MLAMPTPLEYSPPPFHLSISSTCASRGTQVIETGAVDAAVFDQIEDLVQVLAGLACQCEAKAHLLADVDAVLEAAHGPLESALDAAELVMDGRICAVEADADIGEF